jgi:hypothetical protein
MSIKPCKREDLEAIVASDAYWSVDKEGNAVKKMANRSQSEITAYHCSNCGLYFDTDEEKSLGDAWQEALEHLKGLVGVK